MYTHNKYPRCYDSDALHELTPMLACQWLDTKAIQKSLSF